MHCNHILITHPLLCPAQSSLKCKWPPTPCSPGVQPSRTHCSPAAIELLQTSLNWSGATNWTSHRAIPATVSDNCPASAPGAAVSLRPSAGWAA